MVEDPGTTCQTADRRAATGGRSATATAPSPPVDEHAAWYPRLLSWYARTENAHWSRRLEADVRGRQEDARTPPRPRWTTAATSCGDDCYGREDAYAAFLRRAPASFAVFGRPGLPADSVAAALSAYWGCVHVSVAAGLAAADDGAVAADLRRGLAVNVAADGRAGRLVRLLGLESPRVRERGYVLTGLPRPDPELSASAQLDAVFAANAPDVLIYMSCPDADLRAYRAGLILESAAHASLTQTLHLADGGDDSRARNVRHVRWYEQPPRDGGVTAAAASAEEYADAVDAVVKRFDPGRVITVDGRRPVAELFETVRARLTSMPLQRTVVPAVVRDGGRAGDRGSADGDDVGADVEEDEDEEGGFFGESEAWGDAPPEDDETASSGRGDGDGAASAADRTGGEDRAPPPSEFGRLCPVSFGRGSYRVAGDDHCAEFAGKLYRFAGPDELRSFVERPRRYLDVPRPGLPFRAVFYGPRELQGPAAAAVRRHYGADVIDVDRVTRAHRHAAKRTYVSALVGSVLETARRVTHIQDHAPGEVAAARTAIGDWTRLYFGAAGSDAEPDEPDGGESEREVFEDDYSDNETQAKASTKKEQFMFLKNYFESNGIDFIYDLNACKRAYDEPETLIKCFQNMPKRNRKMFRLNFLNENTTDPFQLIDVIVDTLRTKSRKNKNWIIVNAPLDFLLVKKLNAEALHPIQIVFFHDTDPVHKVLLSGEISDEQYNKVIRETIENVKNGMRHGTVVERISYPEFVRKMESSSNAIRSDEYLFAEDEEDVEEYNDQHGYNISHELLMEVILPEITERINRYMEDLLEQWRVLQTNISKETKSQYVDFAIIECKPDLSPMDAIKILIEDTLYYVKKFSSENVYDVSTDDDTAPTVGRYDGDTSIYCPVMFANGKLSIGSKKHAAMYQNRYYYMKSDRHFRAFIANPDKYASFTVPPGTCPKLKISLYCPLGVDAKDMFENVLDAFDLTWIDSHEMFKNNVLPENTPMLGEIYEEPTLRDVFDRHFVSAQDDRDRVDGLRKYVDKESAHLSDGDWEKMNAPFFRTDEGICYKNYPANPVELAYLKANDMLPDAFVQVTVDGRAEHGLAKKAVAENWSTYRRALIERAVARDGAARRRDAAERSASFRERLAALRHAKRLEDVRARLRRVLRTTAAETGRGPDATGPASCDSPPPPPPRSGRGERPSDDGDGSGSSAPAATLTLKRKKIAIAYGLDRDDFRGLDDLAVLERIDEAIRAAVPAPEWLTSKCLPGGGGPPPDAVVERHAAAAQGALAAMRESAEASGVPWLTVPAADRGRRTAALDRLAGVLSDVRGGAPESAYAVDADAAERMLCAGEAHLSRFGRGCPVEARRHPDSTPRFYADRADGRACPAVYRDYVYYASGPENRDEFVRRPWEYARGGAAAATVHLPALRVAVLGPPRCGKSRCARELCGRYGLQPVRVDERLVRAYLAECGWTDGAADAWTRLRRGGALDDVTLAAVVDWATKGPRAVAHGYVLDGYPVTENQFRLLDESGVLLHRVFVLGDLRDDDDDDDDTERDQERDVRAVPAALMRHRREAWTREAAAAGPWLSDRYGDAVVAVVCRDRQDRGRLMRESVAACVRSLREYGARADAGLPCRVAGLPVPEPEYRAKAGAHRDACPACPAGRGPVAADRVTFQYRHRLYRVCARHGDAFAGDARRYAAALVPRRTVAADVVPGREPRRTVAGRGAPVAAVRRLPAPGYLEQTFGAHVARALTLLDAARPAYPGLSAGVAAAVFVGLRLAADGGADRRGVDEHYRRAFRRFADACRLYKRRVSALESAAAACDSFRVTRVSAERPHGADGISFCRRQ